MFIEGHVSLVNHSICVVSNGSDGAGANGMPLDCLSVSFLTGEHCFMIGY
jgi:hypothetical protein